MDTGKRSPPSEPLEPSASERLDSWKEIATYLKRDESTVRRWEKEGLPVHRHAHKKKATVYAYKPEVDVWWNDGRARLELMEDAAKGRQWKLAGWIAAALTFMAVGVVGFNVAGLRDLFLGQAARPGIGASGRPAIAVMPFENSSSSEETRWLSQGVPNMLLTGLAQTPGLDVISGQRLREAARQTGQGDLETLDKGLLPGVARQAGAGVLVTGSILPAGAEVRIDIQVEDVSTGRLLTAYSARGQNVFPLVDDMTAQIQKSLNLPVEAPDTGITAITSASLEAYRLYIEGLTAKQHVRERDAERLFNRAVELDPSFAMAYFQLFDYADSRGQSALAEEYRRKILENKDRLPERQKLFVQAAFALRTESDPDKAIGLLEELLVRYPDEEEAYLWLARSYGTLNQRDRALAALERGVRAVPQSGILHNIYGYSLLYADRVPEGLHEFKVYTRLYPEESNSWDSLAEAYLITYQPEKALKEYGEVLRRFPSRGSARRGRAWAFAMLGRYPEALDEFDTLYPERFLIYRRRTGTPSTGVYFVKAFLLSRLGRYREAEELIRRGMEETARFKDHEQQAAFEALASLVALERADNARASRSAGRALSGIQHGSESPRVNPVLGNVLAGLAEARAGNPTAARANLESVRKTYNPSQPVERWWYHCLEGEIAFAAGDWAAAESAFAAGEPTFRLYFNNSNAVPSVFANNLFCRDWRARIKKARGDFPGAIEAYRKLLTPGIRAKWVAVYEPRFVLEMARLYEQSGDQATAQREYQRFAELWKNADPGLPELQEARQRFPRQPLLAR